MQNNDAYEKLRQWRKSLYGGSGGWDLAGFGKNIYNFFK